MGAGSVGHFSHAEEVGVLFIQLTEKLIQSKVTYPVGLTIPTGTKGNTRDAPWLDLKSVPPLQLVRNSVPSPVPILATRAHPIAPNPSSPKVQSF